MSKEKSRRSRGDLIGAVRRLWPYIRPHTKWLLYLVVATLCWGGANAARAWLLKSLLNDVMLRGGPKDEVKDHVWVRSVPDEEVKRAKADCWNDVDEKTLGQQMQALKVPIGFGAPEEIRNDKLSQILQRTYRALQEAADELVQEQTALAKKHQAEPEEIAKARASLAKALAYQRGAHRRCPDPLASTDETRRLAAGLSLAARTQALEANFATTYGDLWWIFWASLGLAVGLAIFHFAMFYSSRALVTWIVVEIQNKLAAHLLTLSIRYFNDERRGELFSRLTNDLNNVQSVLTMLLSDVVIQPLTLAVLVGAAFWVSPVLASSLILLSLTVFLPVRIWGRKIRRSARERQTQVANVLESMQQMFAGIRIVKAFRREEYETKNFHRRTRDYLRAALSVVRARTASKSWMEFTNDVTIPIVCLAGGYLVLKNMWGLDVGKFAMFIVLVASMYMPAKILAVSYNTLQDSLPSVDRVFEVFDTRPELVDAADALPLEHVREAIRFENVSFGYDGTREVLHDVTFAARAGEVTAIVGPTAAGKSTLVDLIARFYDPTNGRVSVDGVDMRKIKLASLLDKVAVVTQEPFLFNDTVKENIRYGRLEATDEEIEAAAKAARIHDEIALMPEKYLTNVGERGAKLSGGQRQRITIARAILKNPEILILDEATSALDTQTERQVQEALDALEKGRTTFVIAHRLSTVQHANRILVLHEGRLAEEGRHDELVAKGGLYAELVKRQELVGAPQPNGNGANAAHVAPGATAPSGAAS